MSAKKAAINFVNDCILYLKEEAEKNVNYLYYVKGELWDFYMEDEEAEELLNELCEILGTRGETYFAWGYDSSTGYFCIRLRSGGEIMRRIEGRL